MDRLPQKLQQTQTIKMFVKSANVTARQALALVQMPAGKPVRLPKHWAERWELRFCFRNPS